MKNRIIRITFFAILAILIGSGLKHYMNTQELAGGVIEMPEDKKSENAGMSLGEPQIGGEFVLLNENGETVTQNDFKNYHKLVFFGFTFCPAVCPTELGRMAKVMEALGEEKAAKVKPMFITVDPERDTPEVVGEYVKQYHPQMVGLTGTPEQINDVKDSFKVYGSKVENEMMEGGYMMDHSTFMYFMSPENNLIKLYSTDDTVEFIAEDVAKTIE